MYRTRKIENLKPSDLNVSAEDFTFVKELGFGSFGKVKLVKRKADGKQLAIKSILMSKVSQKEKDAALNEIRLLASINIPNVIEYMGSFYDSQQQSLCIVMEFADGGDLEHMITDQINCQKKAGLSQNFIWKVAYEVLSGLKRLHENNIVHRDIKTANIFFVNGIAKLGDLNISKVTDNGFCSTQTGTPYYTSPEIWKGETYNSKCDIWALGCIIYEMATLSPPFKANDFPSLFKAITEGSYKEIDRGYSEDLRIFIKLCLNVQASRRPSAAELLETNILSGMSLCLENFDNAESGEINLIDPIKCPKVLRFLNSKLPQRSEKVKKTVKMCPDIINDHEMGSSNNFKIKSRKIRSQKVINISEEPTSMKVISSVSRKNIKLPPISEKQKSKAKEGSVNCLEFTNNSSSKAGFKIKKHDNTVAKSMKCIGGKQNSRPIV